jgi:hypothetical protein
MKNRQRLQDLNIKESQTVEQVLAVLDYGINQLDHETLDKLSTARGHALNAFAKQAQTAHNTDGVGPTLRFFGDYIQGHRMLASGAVVLSMAFIAFLLTTQMPTQDINGQGDAFLLGSDLPPEAFADRGFDTWLANS